jgi:hypothetical protein
MATSITLLLSLLMTRGSLFRFGEETNEVVFGIPGDSRTTELNESLIESWRGGAGANQNE